MVKNVTIHPTAIVEEGAELHETVAVGPYSIVESGAILGPGCVIESNARVYGETTMGSHNRICHGATIGATPQDISYTPERAKRLSIGDQNVFREGVNVSHGVKEDHGTVIGNHNLFMFNCHIAHDCIVGDHNIFANTATLAGHVIIAHHCVLSAHTAIHQFCRVGAYAMLGGISGVRQDIPPYATANGQYARFVGLNLVGLKRNGFDATQRTAIKRAYRTLYDSGLTPAQALEELRTHNPSPEVATIIEFVENSQRGLITRRARED